MKNSDPDKFRTFGRAKGRPLSGVQQRLFDDLYPTVKIDLANPLAGLDRFDKVAFEIGIGGAEHLLWQAARNPDTAFIGAEPFQNGIAKALRGIDSEALDNVILHHGDARDILDVLPSHALDTVYVLFPDPWPKPKHHKRRIINPTFLNNIHRVLKPGGIFRFGSDIIHYVDWTLTRVSNHGGFDWSPQSQADWRVRHDDWPSTRYLEKALREGRTGHFFTFTTI
ncbi:tRNA (guanosine(46)-N7)-methyltransferase TrmB [Fretibacter rubidus]|uniref:tRNA (guanosine(46)-N7)-methyltransferase TrmB n=1 Tax=Fretibacter rubidus TaxID=570162 RepID=UPI00352AE72C